MLYCQWKPGYYSLCTYYLQWLRGNINNIRFAVLLEDHYTYFWSRQMYIFFSPKLKIMSLIRYWPKLVKSGEWAYIGWWNSILEYGWPWVNIMCAQIWERKCWEIKIMKLVSQFGEEKCGVFHFLACFFLPHCPWKPGYFCL